MNEIREQDRGSGSGIFISFEGGEGAGKSTHIRFLSKTLQEHGYEVLSLREPGGTKIGEQLRDIVLDNANAEITDQAELLMYEAARAQIVAEIIRPALARGAVVLCDRFSDSTLAYQGYGRGLSKDFIKKVNDFSCQGVHPDRTILMSCGNAARVGLERATHTIGADRVENAGEEFHTRVNEGFMEIAQAEPARIRTVVSADRKSQTSKAVFSELSDIFPWMSDLIADEEYFAELDIKHE